MLYDLFISFRPTTWIRIAAEMLLGASVSAFAITRFPLFLLGFIAAGPLLWSAAYMLNDISDIKLDQKHISRKFRPITTGKISKKTALITIVIFTCAALVLGSFINKGFVLGLIILGLSEIFYTLKPFRFKEILLLDFLANALNAAVRFCLGYICVSGNLYGISTGLLFFAVFVKLFFFTTHRLQNRELEIKNKFKSTIALLSLKQINILLITLFALICLSYYSTIIYTKVTIFLLLAPIISFIPALPILFLNKNYLKKQEKNIHTRVYMYLIFLLFSVLVFIGFNVKI